MAQRPRRRHFATRVLVLACAVSWALGCAGRGHQELIPGVAAEEDLAAVVDSEPAARLLADLLARRSPDPRLAALAPSILGTDLVRPRETHLATDPGRFPDQVRLRELALEVSLDFAALAFARAIGADEESSTVQAIFEGAVRDGPAVSQEVLRRSGAFPYRVLFAPAWLYRSFPESGADFARQRRLLHGLGVPHRLIETDQSGSVEANAATIAQAVRESEPYGRGLILVSSSKSGAEVALALSRLLTPEESARVAGWLNVGGALHGTPHADAALRRPASWMTRSILWLAGWNWAGVTSMTTEASRKRLAQARLPDSVAVVNLVAVPLSRTVSVQVYGGYEFLRPHGPNDGVVLLADSLWPGGVNVVALGADHLFAPLQQDGHGLAMLRAMDLAVRRHRARPAPAAAVSDSARPGIP